MTQRVVVVGAGLVGLSCAVQLAEAGFEVDVLARDLPGESASASVGGLWLPPSPATPGAQADVILRWARTSYLELARLADEAGAGAGVRRVPGRFVTAPDAPGGQAPAWAPFADLVEAPSPDGEAILPLADMPAYLEYLRRRLEACGGSVTRLPIPALPTRGLVVNCSGTSARALAGDPDVRPLRHQSLVLEDPGLDAWTVEPGPAGLGVLPFGNSVLVAGPVVADEWSPDPDLELAAELHRRAVAMVPRLRDAAVRGHRVGLLPSRPQVRLEVERPRPDDSDHVVVHCYGHAGDVLPGSAAPRGAGGVPASGVGGVATAWGCAGDLVDVVRDLRKTLSPR